MFNTNSSNANISKWKNIFSIFFCIPETYIKFGILSKKRSPSEFPCFWNFRLPKGGLFKCFKSPVSQHLWPVNMLKGPKHCLNLHGRILVTFFDHSERKSAQKILFYYYLKSWDCLLTYWHPMTNTLSQQKRVSNGTNWNAMISNTKNICSIFFFI